MPEALRQRPYSGVTIEILQDETFDLPHQLMVMNSDGTRSPLDLTQGGAIPSPRLDFYIRPRFDHSELIKHFSTDLAVGGIILDDPATGKIAFYREQPLVAAEIPVSDRRGWDCFLVWTLGERKIELYRGPFIVHPGRYPA